MSNRVFSSSMRRMSLALGLALVLLWLLSGALITPNIVQAQPIDLTRSLSAVQTTAWYVAPPPLGNDANDCSSLATPCATLGAAIGKASAGDTINIATGTYTENVTVAIPLNFVGAGASNTIVDGNHVGRVFNIVSGTVASTRPMR